MILLLLRHLLLLGVGQLRAVVKAGQYAYSAYIAVGVGLTIYNLARFQTDIDGYLDQAARESKELKTVLDILDQLSIVYDLSNVAVSRIVTKNNKQSFTDLVASWAVAKKLVFSSVENNKDGGVQKAPRFCKLNASFSGEEGIIPRSSS